MHLPTPTRDRQRVVEIDLSPLAGGEGGQNFDNLRAAVSLELF